MTWTIDEYQERTGKTLLPQHHAQLVASSINLDVAAARGYWTEERKSDLRDLGFSLTQQRVPALVVPVHGVTGEVVLHQIRPDDPRRNGDGKAIKYETPRKARMALDVPPTVRPLLGNPNVPLMVTEGARKADSAASAGLCCVAVAGVWNWRGSNDHGGTVALPDWEHIALNDRTVYLTFDSDVTTKPPVQHALARLKEMLERRQAHVLVVYLPCGPNGEKVGLDDFLAAGHSKDDVLHLASTALRQVEQQAERTHPYRAEPSGLVWEKPTKDGSIDVLLSNFTARIGAEVVEDDGVEQRRLFQMSARLKGRPYAFEIPASSFDAMSWITEHLGAEAILSVGDLVRAHVHNAIQHLSESVPVRSVFAHTGWRRADGEAVFLHGGGALGPQGPLAGTETRLDGGLARYVLPDPPGDGDLQEAVCASLSLLDVAPDQVTVALLAMVYRAPLGRVDFSGFLVGPSGAGKSELAALAQQHYGGGMDRLHLPASWSSTGNALEGTAFQAKDVLLVIDDFAPTGTVSDVQRLHREAERLLRAQGNASARQRMRADTTLRPPKPPRGLLLGTGEDVPRGHSLRSRLVVIEVGPADVDWTRVSALQDLAASGRLAAAMAGYLRWLAHAHHDEADRVEARFQELRQAAASSAAHRRTPAAIANLAIGFERFLQFAEHVGAIDAVQRQRLWERAWCALGDLSEAQGEHLLSAEPTVRFLSLLQAALASGEAHVAAPSGEAPTDAVSWGLRLRTFGNGEHDASRWEPQGRRVGWLDGRDLYLEPEASFAACQRLGQAIDEPLTINQRTLEKRLRERGLLASVERGRRRLRVRVSGLEGQRRAVLHLQTTAVFPELPVPPPDDARHQETSETGVGPVFGAGPTSTNGKTAQKNGPPKLDSEFSGNGAGPVGPVGPVSGDIREPAEEIKEWRA